MKALRVDTHFEHRKQIYVVTAERPKVGEDVDVAITLNGEQLHFERVSCKNAFGSGVCRSVFEAWLRRQRPAKATDRPRPRPASPRLFGKDGG